MKNPMKFLSVFIFVLISSSLASAKISTTCSDQTSAEGKRFDYCVRTNTESKALIYFFHGLMGSSNSYKKFMTTPLDPLWEKKGLAVPNVISISFGTNWLLSEAEGGAQLFKVFKDSVMPTLEKDFQFDQTFKRSIIGMSMGGFNASQVFAKLPNQFERIALLCPAFTTISPWAPQAEVDAYIKRTGAYTLLVNMAINLAQNEFVKPEMWDAENPFANLAKMAPLNIPTYVAVGDKDQYGFQEGALAYSEAMKSKTDHVEFYLVKNGGHCAYPLKELAAFFEPSLQ